MNFECRNCGECCSNYLPLSKTELQRLRRLAKKENKHPIRQDWYDRCPFLNNENKCDIYEDRPIICREYLCIYFKDKIYPQEVKEKLFKEQPLFITNLREEFFRKEKQ